PTMAIPATRPRPPEGLSSSHVHVETGPARGPFSLVTNDFGGCAPASLDGAEARGEALEGNRQVHAFALGRRDARLSLAAGLEGADRGAVHQDIGKAAVAPANV